MVSPVGLNTNYNTRVNFRGSDNMFGAPSPFTQPEGVDEFAAENAKPKKKGKFGKILLAVLGTALVAGGALFGLYKLKGAKANWINKEAAGFMPKLKNALAVAGQWIDTKVVTKGLDFVTNIFKRAPKVAEGAAEAATKTAG